MCSPEEEALLRLEEVFSATLARVNSLVLLPLLETSESRLGSGKGGGHRKHPGDPSPTLLDLLRHSFLHLKREWGHLVSASSNGTGALAPAAGCSLLRGAPGVGP